MSDLYLYEIGNGYIGCAYVRVYVIAATDREALSIALRKFSEYYDDSRLEIVAKVKARTGFCSEPCDEGLEVGG